MSLTPVLEKLKTVGATASKNDKLELLREYLKDGLFNLVVRYTLQPTLRYHCKKLPPYQPTDKVFHIKELFKKLNYLAAQPGASDADKEDLAEIASSFGEDTWEVVHRIVQKKLKCGATAASINRAAGERLIKIVAYMRCKTHEHIKNMTFPLLAQLKADGQFCYMIIDKDAKFKFMTRNAKTVFQLEHLHKELHHLTKHREQVYHGELVVYDENFEKFLPRKEGNGILNSCMQKSCDPAVLERIVFRVWDVVSEYDFWNGRCDTGYRERFSTCSERVITLNNKRYFETVKSKYVQNIAEADEYYVQLRQEGEEGCILKHDHAGWKNCTSGSKDMCKMKEIKEAELRYIGWEYGDSEGKYRTVIGSLLCESECGKLKVSVSGLTDKQRGVKGYETLANGEEVAIPDPKQFDRWDSFEGDILEVEYNEVIQDDRTKVYSLFLPRIVDFRNDKDVADTLKFLLAKEEVH